MNTRERRSALTAWILGAVLGSWAAPAWAGRWGGAQPFDFLFLEAGAEQGALGGAFTAGSGSADVIAYNPAGLASMGSRHAVFTHQQHFQDVTRERFAAAGRSGLGFAVDYLSYGELQRTTLSAPDGGGLGGFTPKAWTAAAGLGIGLSESLSAGAAGKFIREEIDDARASAWAADAGLQLEVLADPRWRLGVAVQNLGPRVRFESAREPLPLVVRWGSAAYAELLGRRVGWLFDVVQEPDGGAVINTGVTVLALEHLALRVGYNGRNDAGLGLTAGFGLALGSLSADYAIVPYGPLGFSHQMGLGWRWGGDWTQ
ncbi:MAG: hypothetical protein A2X36_16475 [Elusimicrobia bacterium GWA2_69_24]|nr:MAG: hypothetical protein A2X36_16475 [Elusimicrobia bacterium GWA2_69_24]HBL18431.1 hypothetical protein [Elusimicrobiota bacterium]